MKELTPCLSDSKSVCLQKLHSFPTYTAIPLPKNLYKKNEEMTHSVMSWKVLNTERKLNRACKFYIILEFIFLEFLSSHQNVNRVDGKCFSRIYSRGIGGQRRVDIVDFSS